MPDVSEDEIHRGSTNWPGPWPEASSRGIEPIRRRNAYTASGVQDRLFEPAKWQAAARWQVAEQELLDLLARDEYVPKVKIALEAGWPPATSTPALKAGCERARMDSPDARCRGLAGGVRHRSDIGRCSTCGLVNQTTCLATIRAFSITSMMSLLTVSAATVCCLATTVWGCCFRPQIRSVPTPMRCSGSSTCPRRGDGWPTRCYLKIGESKRFVELSRRTLDNLLAQKRPLKEAELMMLEHLDAVAVSRFASGYLAAHGDPEPPDRLAERRTGRGSPYQSLCCLLVERGTRDAAPGLLAAIEAKRFPPLAGEGACAWHWLAALAIAQARSLGRE